MASRRDLNRGGGRTRAGLIVGAGGLIGAPLRYLIGQRLPVESGNFPLATFLINVSGAFALGLLLEVLGSTRPQSGRRRDARLLLGTGLLGAFTTYSGLAVEVALLIRHGSALLGLLYGTGSAVSGLLAAAAGVAAAIALRRSAP